MSINWAGVLPGLLLAGGLAGKNMGMFGNGMASGDTAANNQIWQRLGQQQLPNGMPNQAMAGAPMQLPGAAMQQPGADAIARTLPQPPQQQLPPQANPQAFAHEWFKGSMSMPNGLSGGQMPMQGMPMMGGMSSLPSQARVPTFTSMPNRGLLG